MKSPLERIARGILVRKQHGRSQDNLMPTWRTNERVALQTAEFAGPHSFHRKMAGSG